MTSSLPPRESVFLSDLHFTSLAEPRCQRILDFLAAQRDAEAIYLVGDVFDFWLGHDLTLYRAYFPLLRALADLADAGVAVHLFSGNHDPDPGALFGELGITVHEGPLATQIGPHRVWLEHGDLIDPRGLRRTAPCHFVRNRWVRRAARVIPPAPLMRLAHVYAHKPHIYGAPLPKGIAEEWFAAKVAEGFDVVIIGHYHRAVQRSAGAARFFALGDWREQFTYLRYAGGPAAEDFTLMRHREDGPDRPLPEGDHGP